jgi:lipoyl(octanoyl) transferase
MAARVVSNWARDRQARRLTNRPRADKASHLCFMRRIGLIFEEEVPMSQNLPDRRSRVGFLADSGSPPVEWAVSGGITDYAAAVAEMEARADAIARGDACERVWLIEHPPLYTAGTSTDWQHLRSHHLPVYQTGRGGQFTYHGPGQRVAYVMLNLRKRRQDLRAFVLCLEDWIIATLAAFEVTGERRSDRVGVWVKRPDKPAGIDGSKAEDKIAAIGIRVRRWVSFHGISLNVDPELRHFQGIVPCGIGASHFGVTSLSDLGHRVPMHQVDAMLHETFAGIFGPSQKVDFSASAGL